MIVQCQMSDVRCLRSFEFDSLVVKRVKIMKSRVGHAERRIEDIKHRTSDIGHIK